VVRVRRVGDGADLVRDPLHLVTHKGATVTMTVYLTQETIRKALDSYLTGELDIPGDVVSVSLYHNGNYATPDHVATAEIEFAKDEDKEE
jgi:hypothetical protein